MTRGLNRVQLIGNLGKDPELKYTPSGVAVTHFSLAVNRSVRAPDEAPREEVEWFRIVAWQKLAEVCNEYLRTGSRIYIDGRLQTRKWADSEGREHSMVEVVARELLMLDSKPDPLPLGELTDDDQPF